MALPVRRQGDRWFVRGLRGYATEAEARAAAKDLWWQGSVVRVEARRGRWDVWREVGDYSPCPAAGRPVSVRGRHATEAEGRGQRPLVAGRSSAPEARRGGSDVWREVGH